MNQIYFYLKKPETGDAFFEVRHREPFKMLGQSSIRLLGVVLGGRASSGAHFLAQQLFFVKSKSIKLQKLSNGRESSYLTTWLDGVNCGDDWLVRAGHFKRTLKR